MIISIMVSNDTESFNEHERRDRALMNFAGRVAVGKSLDDVNEAARRLQEELLSAQQARKRWRDRMRRGG